MRKTMTTGQKLAQKCVDIGLIAWISVAIVGALLLAISMGAIEATATALTGQSPVTQRPQGYHG